MTSSAPIDVEKFMELPRVSADSGRLDKAVWMLKSDRLRFAEAGEVDWRPTETVPEDFFSL